MLPPVEAHDIEGHVAGLFRQTVVVSQLNDLERASRLTALRSLLDLMRPAVQADGGDLVLIRADVESGVVEVQLQGACSSCAISSDTLQGGVTRILKDRLSWVTDVLGGVDDSIDLEESASLGVGGYIPRYRDI
jgi:Fe-S cluster biogenesis protein NfuA